MIADGAGQKSMQKARVLVNNRLLLWLAGFRNSRRRVAGIKAKS
jgi:hypothetical protein